MVMVVVVVVVVSTWIPFDQSSSWVMLIIKSVWKQAGCWAW
jgi:hypothetical protein